MKLAGKEIDGTIYRPFASEEDAKSCAEMIYRNTLKRCLIIVSVNSVMSQAYSWPKCTERAMEGYYTPLNTIYCDISQ